MPTFLGEFSIENAEREFPLKNDAFVLKMAIFFKIRGKHTAPSTIYLLHMGHPLRDRSVRDSLHRNHFRPIFTDESQTHHRPRVGLQVSKNDESCIENEESCIKNEEPCIKNEEFCIKNDEFCI